MRGMVSVARFKAFVFDFDGVIVDSEVLQARAWGRVAGELGMGGVEIDVRRTAGKLDRVIAPELFPDADHAWCLGRKKAIERELEEAHGVPYIEETLELAGRLRGTHRLGICSSSSPGRIREVLERRGVSGWFDVIVGQVEGEACKPDPGPYLKAIRLLGVVASEACALEDSATGVAAAKGAGLYVIQLLHEGMGRCEMADAVVGSAGEIFS